MQVLGWIVAKPAVFTAVRSRSMRLLLGNLATVSIGVSAYLVVRKATADDVEAAALAAGVVGVGLVVGMLFESWPFSRLRWGRPIAVSLIVALAWLAVTAFERLAPLVGVSTAEAGT